MTRLQMDTVWAEFRRDFVPLACSLVGDSDYEDALGETYLRLVELLPTFRERGRCQTFAWMEQVLRQVCRSRDRTRHKRVLFLEDLPEMVAPQGENYRRRALYEILCRASLSYCQRQAILLHLEGTSFRECARTLGVQPGTIGQHYRRGVEKLRQQFDLADWEEILHEE